MCVCINILIFQLLVIGFGYLVSRLPAGEAGYSFLDVIVYRRTKTGKNKT